jgi:hypothetical protein
MVKSNMGFVREKQFGEIEESKRIHVLASRNWRQIFIKQKEKPYFVTLRY